MLDRVRDKNPLPAGALPVAVGLVVAGIANFVFLPIASRALDESAYDALTVLWSLVFAAGNGLMQPLEQEVARASSERRARSEGPGPVIRMAGLVGLTFALGVTVVALATRTWILDRLFNGYVSLELAFIVGLFAFGIGHLTRGTLSSHGRFRAYGWFFSLDGVIRVAPVIALAVAGVTAVGPYALALAFPPAMAAGLVLWRQRGLYEPGPPAHWHELSKALGWLVAGTVSIALVQQGGPIAVQLLAGPDETGAAGAFKNGMVLVTIPLFMFQAVLASLLPRLSHLASVGEFDEFRSGLWRLIGAIFAVGVVAVALAGTIGPTLVSKIFASTTTLGGRDLALMAAAVIVIIAAICLDQALIALSGHSRMAVGWMIALAVFIGVIAIGTDLFLRVELGLLAASVVAFVWMLGWLGERMRHHAKGHEVNLAQAAAEQMQM